MSALLVITLKYEYYTKAKLTDVLLVFFRKLIDKLLQAGCDLLSCSFVSFEVLSSLNLFLVPLLTII